MIPICATAIQPDRDPAGFSVKFGCIIKVRIGVDQGRLFVHSGGLDEQSDTGFSMMALREIGEIFSRGFAADPPARRAEAKPFVGFLECQSVLAYLPQNPVWISLAYDIFGQCAGIELMFCDQDPARQTVGIVIGQDSDFGLGEHRTIIQFGGNQMTLQPATLSPASIAR